MNKKIRVIICSDAKNEADDQYAIVHALLTPKFDIKGIVAVHFREQGSNELSFQEIVHLAHLTHTYGQYPIVLGANQKIINQKYEYSKGAKLIIEEACKNDARPLYVLNIGALTDLAIAMLECSEISSKLTAIWVGGGRYPEGSHECNLANDLEAARIVFSSQVDLWQIPSNTYKTTLVSIAQLRLRVQPMGKLGHYLFQQLVDFMENNIEIKKWINSECWIMGDLGAIGVLLEEQKSYYKLCHAPDIDDQYRYIENKNNRLIRVYDQLNNYFIIEDMISKIQLFATEEKDGLFSNNNL